MTTTGKLDWPAALRESGFAALAALMLTVPMVGFRTAAWVAQGVRIEGSACGHMGIVVEPFGDFADLGKGSWIDR